MDYKKIFLNQKKRPLSHAQELWGVIKTRGPDGETLRQLLQFYLQHNNFPPPPEKAFESLLIAFTARQTPRKMKALMFHIVEEVCHCLDANCLLDTVRVTSAAVAVDLLNAILISGALPSHNSTVYDRLMGLLCDMGDETITADERSKLLLFVTQTCPPRLVPALTQWLATLLRYCPASRAQLSLFSRVDNFTEVDGSPATGLSTALTLHSRPSEGHVMSVTAFSRLRWWLTMLSAWHGSDSSSAVAELCSAAMAHCDVLVDQSMRRAKAMHDAQLQRTITYEVVLVLCLVAQLRSSFRSDCLGILARLRDHTKDPTTLTYLWQAYIQLVCHVGVGLGFYTLSDKHWSDNQSPKSRIYACRQSLRRSYCEYTTNVAPADYWQHYMLILPAGVKDPSLATSCLGEGVARSFVDGAYCYDLTAVLVSCMDVLSPSLLTGHVPSLLKMAATHPSALATQFVHIVRFLASDREMLVEVLHGLVDLPALSATICVHQTPELLRCGHRDAILESRLAALRQPHCTLVYKYFMRTWADPLQTQQVLPRLAEYFVTLADLSGRGLVVTCSQLAPVLLDRYLTAATDSLTDAPTHVHSLLLIAILTRAGLLYGSDQYKGNVQRVLGQHLGTLFTSHPVLASHQAVLHYLTETHNVDLCAPVYMELVRAVGDYCTSEDSLQSQYECIESVLYEMLTKGRPGTSSAMVNTLSRALAQLSSRHVAMVERARLLLQKVATLHSGQEDVQDNVEELLALLNNKNFANYVLGPPGTEDPAMKAVIRVVAQMYAET